jgi:hypothetical protein
MMIRIEPICPDRILLHSNTPGLTHPEGSYTFKDGKIIQDIARSSYIDPKMVCTKQ